MSEISGNLRKMHSQLAEKVDYTLPVGEEKLPLNERLGQTLTLQFSGKINCTHCGRKSSKSFNQGYCYPCFKRLAQCDSCIVSPEKCHFVAGTCREPEWGEAHCNIDHIVYLANSSAPKIGITRETQVPTRWIDQGAVQALPIARVATRQLSGLFEVAAKDHIADKTNWRAMLKGSPEVADLAAIRGQLFDALAEPIDALQQEHGLNAVQLLDAADEQSINYPVLEYPQKITSLNAEKTPEISGTLMGIKGQYLIFDTGVINIRKYTGYEVTVA
jgi:hypothetical protein